MSEEQKFELTSEFKLNIDVTMKGTIENISIKNSSVKFSSEKYWMLIKEDSLFEQVTKLGKGKEVSYEFTWDALAKKRVLKSISSTGLDMGNKINPITLPKESKQGTGKADSVTIIGFDELIKLLSDKNKELDFFLRCAREDVDIHYSVRHNLDLIVSVKHTMASEKLARIMDDRS